MTAPCPVCGSHAYPHSSTIRPWWCVVCSVCGTFGPLGSTRQEAVELWDDNVHVLRSCGWGS